MTLEEVMKLISDGVSGDAYAKLEEIFRAYVKNVTKEASL